MLVGAMGWGWASWAHALDLEGVQNAAMDQPHINLLIYPENQSTPLGYETIIFDPDDVWGILDGYVYTIEAYFDTGAGGSLLGNYSSQQYGITRQDNVNFQDVGVGGVAQFDVSNVYNIHLAPSTGSSVVAQDPNPDFSAYNQVYTGQRLSVGQGGAETPDSYFDDLDQIIAGANEFNVLGMPFFQGKTVVMDGRPLNNFIASGQDIDLIDLVDPSFLPQINTYVYNAGPANPNWTNDQNSDHPGIPPQSVTNYTIALSYASFDRFTQVVDDLGNPLDTTTYGPTLAHNPFIGTPPASVREDPDADPVPGVALAEGGETLQDRAFLFDTGAAATMISRGLAQSLGVRYQPGTYHSGLDPILEKLSPDTGEYVAMGAANQFELTIQGVGGQVKLAGFFLDELTVPVMRHDQALGAVEDVIRFLNVPVLIEDIGVSDPLSGEAYTLDGIFGMNLLFASSFVDEPYDIFSLLDTEYAFGAFDWVVFDESAGEVRLALSPYAQVPEPAVMSVLLILIAHLSLKRPPRRREATLA
jgi:hypothetical protein